MGALFDFKCTCDSTLVYVCQADAEKFIFVWTILSQTPRCTPQVTSDAGRISTRIFWLFPKERRMLRKRDYQGRLSFHFFDRWMTDLATHRQKKVQAMSWKNLQMLEFCLFTWSWMGPINCAPNPVEPWKTRIIANFGAKFVFTWNFNTGRLKTIQSKYCNSSNCWTSVLIGEFREIGGNPCQWALGYTASMQIVPLKSAVSCIL